MDKEIQAAPDSPRAAPQEEVQESDTESSPTHSFISDSINECISEGQWMVHNRSEGEIGPFNIDPGIYCYNGLFLDLQN